MKKSNKCLTQLFLFFNKSINCLYFGSIIFLIFIFAFNLFFPHFLMNTFGYGVYRMSSESMNPTIRLNEFVIVQSIDVSSLQTNDIIMFKTHAQLSGAPVTQQVTVMHYFGYMDENHHIYTFKEENKNIDENNPDKYDSWGTISSPYLVKETDILGKYVSTLNWQNWQSFFLTPYPYGLIGTFTFGVAFVLKKPNKKSMSSTSR